MGASARCARPCGSGPARPSRWPTIRDPDFRFLPPACRDALLHRMGLRKDPESVTDIDTMLLPELKKVASSIGLKGAGAMRKSELLSAIRAAQGG
ncbi:Rho termination factor N-terminal domain-containing protein, partial [Escherichia coli]|uniref:Rho termination factor N-terminal domain-containing protein n=1 Tax=Escherichia coli TaxID=562 RepID=UPI0034D386FC